MKKTLAMTLRATRDGVARVYATLDSQTAGEFLETSVFVASRPVVPGITRDARALGVSRQFLSRVLHNPKRYGNYEIYRRYHKLKGLTLPVVAVAG